MSGSKVEGLIKIEKYDGEFLGLGMILGILIGLVSGRFLPGSMLGTICGITMD